MDRKEQTPESQNLATDALKRTVDELEAVSQLRDGPAHNQEYSGTDLNQFGVAETESRDFVWSYVQSKTEDALRGVLLVTDEGICLQKVEYDSVGPQIELPQDLNVTGYSAATQPEVFAGPPSAGLTSELFRLSTAEGIEKTGAAQPGVEFVPLSKVNHYLAQAAQAGNFIEPHVYAALRSLAKSGDYTIDTEDTSLPTVDLAALERVKNRNAEADIKNSTFVFDILKTENQEFAVRNRGACAAIVFTVTENNEVIFVEQGRPPIERSASGGVTIECPAGMVGDATELAGEDPTAAGIREVIEEAGYKPGRMKNLLLCPSTASLSNEMLIFMLAEDAQLVGSGGGVKAEGENIKRHLIPFDQVDAFLAEQEQQGKQIDPKVLTALQLYATVQAQPSVEIPEPFMTLAFPTTYQEVWSVIAERENGKSKYESPHTAILSHADTWATFMEAEIEQTGSLTAAIISETFKRADAICQGSASMDNAAAMFIKDVWKYGADFKRLVEADHPLFPQVPWGNKYKNYLDLLR